MSDAFKERNVLLGRLGLSVEMAPEGVVLIWNGIPAAVATRTFMVVEFPGMGSRVEARRIDRDRGEIRIDNVIFPVATPQIERGNLQFPE